jgi:membrane-bound lytic murein transglycosylase MltF
VDKSAERNIEAGAKYLNFIVDRYYADEDMDKINKGLFAIASYNAGPARINRLRSKTREMGLDPNLWFGNVEIAVANDIGRETVQYVSNIYKYYVTYTMIMAERREREAAKAAATH